MAYPVVIEMAEGRIQVTLNGTVVRGNLLGHDGTNWVQADASSSRGAHFIALNSGVAGDVIKGCRKCVFYDEDAPYTAGATQYLGEDGAITQTIPSAFSQSVGYAVDTKRVAINLSESSVELSAKVGFFNVPPVARALAYTQTYADAERIHAAKTAVKLVNNTGTAAGTALETGITEAIVEANLGALNNELGDLIADHADLAQLVNAIINDLKAYGLLQ